ncbi:hypothetical protein VPNG_05637 [Cytospora leucostoma]|uniref:Uncharacterized protein n=1 Tax=Cytospora leucostoma TaxID=1230097 RepID=A0A423X750_9PEZI|nr:hypothetical protein VPNG_05637 [Cytospora leucostoma]
MNTSYFQMHKQQASSVSRFGASSHSNTTSSNGNRSITTNTTRVLNKINALVRPPEHFLKPRPPPKIAETAADAAERFQIVHKPDRALGTIPLWEIPKTEDEYRAAILNMKMHGQLQPESVPAQQTDMEVRAMSGVYHHFPPRPGYVDDSTEAQPTTRRTKRRRAVRNPGRALADPYTDRDSLAPRAGQYSEPVVTKTMPRVYYPSSPDLLRDHEGLSTPSASAPLSARLPPRAERKRRVASAEVPRPPRPLSERAMIPLGPRARRGEHSVTGLTISSSASTLVGSPAVPTPIHNAIQDGRNTADLEGKARQRSIRGQRSADRIAGKDRERTAGDSGHARPGNPSTARMRSMPMQQETDDARGARPGITHCYVCQEPCGSGGGLCSECRDRYQPLEEVFEYSESEYGDDGQAACVPHPAPGESPTPGWSGSLSPTTSQWQHPRPRPQQGQGQGKVPSSTSRPRSESVSPTPHLALQLKVVPHQSIRKVSVTSPARGGPPSAGQEEEDRRSALYHVQQAMRPREPVSTSPGCASEQGRDVVGRAGGVRSGEERSVGEEGGGGGGADDEYDQIYSIYDAYWNQKEDEVKEGMF